MNVVIFESFFVCVYLCVDIEKCLLAWKYIEYFFLVRSIESFLWFLGCEVVFVLYGVRCIGGFLVVFCSSFFGFYYFFVLYVLCIFLVRWGFTFFRRNMRVFVVLELRFEEVG